MFTFEGLSAVLRFVIRSTRACRGFDLSQCATPEILDQLDMESRWEGYLRAKFEGAWQGTPMDLERFPQGVSIQHPRPIDLLHHQRMLWRLISVCAGGNRRPFQHRVVGLDTQS